MDTSFMGFTQIPPTLREDLPGASECVECVTLILPTPTKDHHPSIFIPEIIHINVHPSFREHNFSDLSTD
jgi:hypothetical protein